MKAMQIANLMIDTFNRTDDLAKAYEHLDGLSYQLNTESGRTRQQALNLFHAYIQLKESEVQS